MTDLIFVSGGADNGGGLRIKKRIGHDISLVDDAVEVKGTARPLADSMIILYPFGLNMRDFTVTKKSTRVLKSCNLNLSCF